jgi:hypothetical protein
VKQGAFSKVFPSCGRRQPVTAFAQPESQVIFNHLVTLLLQIAHATAGRYREQFKLNAAAGETLVGDVRESKIRLDLPVSLAQLHGGYLLAVSAAAGKKIKPTQRGRLTCPSRSPTGLAIRR